MQSLTGFLAKIPQPLLVLICLAIGIVIFYVSNPPPTGCDPNVAQFKKTFVGELSSRKVQGRVPGSKEIQTNVVPAASKKYLEDCRYGNSSGSCYKYFDLLKRVSTFVVRQPSECSETLVDQLPILAKTLRNGLKLMTILAWGQGPTNNPADKIGWLKEYEVSVFCEIKRAYIKLHGEEEWWKIQAGILGSLPNTEAGQPIQLNQNQKVDRSLMSVACEYL